jgi:hypothetical protein
VKTTALDGSVPHMSWSCDLVHIDIYVLEMEEELNEDARSQMPSNNTEFPAKMLFD